MIFFHVHLKRRCIFYCLSVVRVSQAVFHIKPTLYFILMFDFINIIIYFWSTWPVRLFHIGDYYVTCYIDIPIIYLLCSVGFNIINCPFLCSSVLFGLIFWILGLQLLFSYCFYFYGKYLSIIWFLTLFASLHWGVSVVYGMMFVALSVNLKILF